MSVYKKLLEVQAATRSLAANAEGQTGAAKYKYVSGAKLLSIIRPIMDTVGLVLTQEVLEVGNTPTTYMTRSGEKTEMFTTLKIRFTWIDADDGSTLVNEFAANGMNAWDKGLGSALTYAERYYLMKTFHIATDEDDVDALIKDEAIKPTPAVVQARRSAKSQPVSTLSYTPMREDQYWTVVGYHAQGLSTEEGKDYRSSWAEFTHAGKAELARFDADVDNWKVAHGLIQQQ